MKRHHLALGVITSAVTVGGSSASGQVIGTFRWRTGPYCDVHNLTVTQSGFMLNGFDEPCGTAPHFPVSGVTIP